MKIRSLFIIMFLLIVILPLFPAMAQEPTEEPAVVDAGDGVIVPDGNVTVVQAPAEQQETNWTGILAIVLSTAAAVGTAIGIFLKPETQARVRYYAESGEHYAWIGASVISDVIQALGGRRDVVTSKDPAIIAQALRSKDTHIFLSSDVDFSAVIEAYNKTSPVD